MNTRERFQAVMNFQPVDRLPLMEWAMWWDKTIERWQSEGLPTGDRYEITRYFDMDMNYQGWIPALDEGCPEPACHGAPLIRSIDEYLKIKPYLYPADAARRDPWKDWEAEQGAGDAAVWMTLEGFFWFPRRLLGIENHFYTYYDQPELIHLITTDLLEFHLRTLHELLAVCKPDFMTFAEDMSYNRGPMVSEDIFKEFIQPYYLKVTPLLREHGVKIIVDSDGDIYKLADWFEGCGVDGFLPLERQAGVDIAQLRREHPRQVYIGAFDKMTMNCGEAAMRAEFERLMPVARQGGFIISCDHQTHPGVSLEDYRLYLKLFNEYARSV
jgi:hypothetical protein